MCVLMFCVKFLNNIIRLVFDLRLTAGDQTTKHHVSCQIRNAGLGKPGHLLIRQTYTRTLRTSRVRCCADVQIYLPHAGLRAAALACAGRPAQHPQPHLASDAAKPSAEAESRGSESGCLRSDPGPATLCKPLTLSEPSFPHLYNGDDEIPAS